MPICHHTYRVIVGIEALLSSSSTHKNHICRKDIGGDDMKSQGPIPEFLHHCSFFILYARAAGAWVFKSGVSEVPCSLSCWVSASFLAPHLDTNTSNNTVVVNFLFGTLTEISWTIIFSCCSDTTSTPKLGGASAKPFYETPKSTHKKWGL